MPKYGHYHASWAPRLVELRPAVKQRWPVPVKTRLIQTTSFIWVNDGKGLAVTGRGEMV